MLSISGVFFNFGSAFWLLVFCFWYFAPSIFYVRYFVASIFCVRYFATSILCYFDILLLDVLSFAMYLLSIFCPSIIRLRYFATSMNCFRYFATSVPILPSTFCIPILCIFDICYSIFCNAVFCTFDILPDRYFTISMFSDCNILSFGGLCSIFCGSILCVSIFFVKEAFFT